ncbi:hypothetical protein QJQ45_023979 [Haematococcus lacustris]|nr:hypothetical protein QJQ45_023979 [Haematococcus lacustris]
MDCVASVIIKVASGAVHAAEASGITKGLSKAGVDTNSLGKVGSAGVTALEEAVPLQVFTALETAGESVLHSLSSATTTVVHHRCGAQAATATQLGMGAAISVVQARRNLNVLCPTRMLRNTAKHTAVIAMKAQGGAKAAVVVEPEHRNGTADAKLSAPDRLALTNGQALQGNGAVDGGLWRPEVTEVLVVAHEAQGSSRPGEAYPAVAPAGPSGLYPAVQAPTAPASTRGYYPNVPLI